MTIEEQEKVDKIKQYTKRRKEFAQRIMDGGENYDGADGAREVLDLCQNIEYLFTLLK